MKNLCHLLLVTFILSLSSVLAFAEDDFKIYLFDNFEAIDVGRHPLYKDGYWSGDTLRTSYCSYLDVIKEDDGNKALRLHTKGAGEKIGSASLYIYAYLNDVKEDIVLEADVTAETVDSQINIWLRGATGSNLIKVLDMVDGMATAETTKLCNYEIGHKYHLTAEIFAKTQSMNVYFDDYNAMNVKLNTPLVTALQTLRFSLTGVTDIGQECGCIIDNVKVYESSKKRPESDFAYTAQNLGLHDWSDLTKFFKNNVCFVNGSLDACVDTERVKLDNPAYFEGDKVYAPIDFVLSKLNISYTDSGPSYTIMLNGESITLTLGAGLKLVNGKVYADLYYLTEKCALYLSVKNNVAFFGKHLVCFNTESQAEEIERYVTNTQSEKQEVEGWFPTKEQLKQDIEKTSANVHPRVLATKDDFDRIREIIKTDSAMASWYEEIKRQADFYVTQPPFTKRTTDGVRMDTNVISRFETMGMVYNIEGGEQYAKKAYEDMKTICEYDDWMPQSFILTGQMMNTMAIGYDWFYNSMTPDQRKEIAKGMYDLGLACSLACYRRQVIPGATDIETRSMLQWLGDQSNWTAVGNGGTVMAAAALYDEYPDECIEAIWNAFQSIENFYATTEPDGGCTEGPGYWAYSRIYYVNMVAVLNSAFGTDYNRYTAGGFDKSGYFPIYMQNEASRFTFSDDSSYIMQTPLYMYFAMRNHDNGLGYYRKNGIMSNLSSPTVYDMIWYRSEFANAFNDLKLDNYFRNVESGSFRDTFNNDFSTFLGFHGGSNAANHCHSDSGTWAFNAHGISWFLDLGKDPLTYTNPTGIQFTSNQLYRIRTEGHNCIVFNPDKSAGQTGIFAPVESFYSAEDGGYALLDLTNIYNEYVTEYKRGYMLTDNRTRAIVQDKFKAKNPSEFYWFAHTRAKISIAPDGKSAILTQNGRQLAVYLKSTDSSLQFEQMVAEPLPTSPNIVGQADSSMFNKLYIHGQNITECEIAVSLVPVVTGETIQRALGSMTLLDQWKIKNKSVSYPKILNVKMNGEDFGGFNSRIFEYMIKQPYEKEEIPEITVEADENCKVERTDFERDLHRAVKYAVINEETGERKNYYFVFNSLPTAVIPSDLLPIKVKDVVASEVIQSEYPPKMLIDGIVSDESRWTGLNEQWVKLDLGKNYDIDGFAISILKGNERQHTFQVYASSDGENYELILNSMNSCTTDGLELFRVKKTNARYVKVQFHGSEISAWNSIKEIQLFGKETEYSKITEYKNDFNDEKVTD